MMTATANAGWLGETDTTDWTDPAGSQENYLWGGRFDMPADSTGEIDSGQCLVSADSYVGETKMVVYLVDDSSVVAESDTYTFDGTETDEIIMFDFSGNDTLTGGNTYYITLWCEGATGTISYTRKSSVGDSTFRTGWEEYTAPDPAAPDPVDWSIKNSDYVVFYAVKYNTSAEEPSGGNRVAIRK